MEVVSVIDEGLNKFNHLTKKPEKFLGVQTQIGEELKQLLKDLYDYTKCSEDSISRSSYVLPELVIKHFDEEQIWQEIELQNDDKCNKFISDVSHLVAGKEHLNFGVGVHHDVDEDINGGCTERSKRKIKKTRVSETPLDSGDEKSSNSAEDDVDENHNSADEEQEDVNMIEDVHTEKTRRKGTINSKPSVVDDRFFKLKDLENYLTKEDRKENRRQKNKVSKAGSSDEEDNDDEESIDYFEDVPSNEEQEEDEDAYYKDFFDPPDMDNYESKTQEHLDEYGNDGKLDSGEDQEDDELLAKGRLQREKQVRFDMSSASNESDSSESESTEKQTGNKSNFEARQERVKSRIHQLEEEALAEKPWQLKGEVSAAARPQNSLLEEIVEFDLTTRPAPIITEQTTLKLEDIIQQRIKDKVWDDVERKVKPVKAPDEYKKKLVMDQEKSKLSLAEVYEQEYIKQREAQDPIRNEKPEEEPKEHQEIRAMMSSLFTKLDALSNFHYTPKPVAPEIKVISNIPAISMEEVAPVATSEAALLAPEEVKAKRKGDIIGKTERTKTDKKRERRRKKAIQRQRGKERENREKIVEKIRPGLGNKYSKERALQMLEKVTKDKNVERMEDLGKDKGVRSSTAFFARLQEEVTSHIKAKTGTGIKKKEKSRISAKKMKL